MKLGEHVKDNNRKKMNEKCIKLYLNLCCWLLFYNMLSC